MQDESNVSSEEELLRLRDEGKIHEQEFHELLEAMNKSSPGNTQLDHGPEFTAFRRRALTYGFVVSVIGLPVGLAMHLPYVWGLSIAGIIIAGTKLGRIKDSRLVVVCPLITFAAGFCIGIPDLVTQLVYGLFPASICAVLVRITQKTVSVREQDNQPIVRLCLAYTLLLSFGAHLVAYLAST